MKTCMLIFRYFLHLVPTFPHSGKGYIVLLCINSGSATVLTSAYKRTTHMLEISMFNRLFMDICCTYTCTCASTVHVLVFPRLFARPVMTGVQGDLRQSRELFLQAAKLVKRKNNNLEKFCARRVSCV